MIARVLSETTPSQLPPGAPIAEPADDVIPLPDLVAGDSDAIAELPPSAPSSTRSPPT
jgi:hypothetical protein